MKKVLLSWSSGKDSAWALHLLSQRDDLHVAGLVTTFNRAANRVAMHAVRRSLVEAQAARAGVPLWPIELPWPCSNADYETIMRGVCTRALAEGIACFAFGDLFLQDIRAYRERQLDGTGLGLLFPVWGIPTRQLALDMIAAGVRAKITAWTRPSSINSMPVAISTANSSKAFPTTLTLAARTASFIPSYMMRPFSPIRSLSRLAKLSSAMDSCSPM